MTALTIRDLRDYAARAVNAKTDIERRLAVSILLQEALRSREALELLIHDQPQSEKKDEVMW